MSLPLGSQMHLIVQFVGVIVAIGVVTVAGREGSSRARQVVGQAATWYFQL